MSDLLPKTSEPVEPEKTAPHAFLERRVRLGLAITLAGFLIFLLGLRPAWFGMATRPGVGFIKISVFLIGLAVICIGGYLSLAALWKPGTHSIPADIGLRLVATGYLIAVFSGMADVFGFGSQPAPMVPSFGHWQASGVEMGEIVIAVGFFAVNSLL